MGSGSLECHDVGEKLSPWQAGKASNVYGIVIISEIFTKEK